MLREMLAWFRVSKSCSPVDTNETIVLDIFTASWGVLVLVLNSDTDEERDLGTLDGDLVEDIAGVEETGLFTSGLLDLLVGVAARELSSVAGASLTFPASGSGSDESRSEDSLGDHCEKGVRREL